MPLMQLIFPSTTLEHGEDQSASDEKVLELDPPGDPELPPDPSDAGSAPNGDDAGDIILWDIVEGAASQLGRGPSASDDYRDGTSALMKSGLDLALVDAFVFGPKPDIDGPDEDHLPDPGDAGGAPDGAGGGDIILWAIVDSDFIF